MNDDPQEPQNILQEANNIVHGPRRDCYDHPSKNFGKIASFWTTILGTPVTPRQVALCMVAVKIARDTHFPQRDNLVDIAGYAATAEMLEEKGQENESA
jgi:hypothetical protein